MAETTQASGGTRRNLIVVAGGQVALLAMWFGATTLLARKLGPEALGLYALCVKAIKIFTSCFGDPLDFAVMREAPIFLRTDRPRALALVRSAFFVRVVLGALIIAITALAPAVISLLMFRSRDYGDLALLTACGIFTDLLLRAVAGFLQASERFARFMTVNATWQIARAGAIVAIIVLATISARSALTVYVVAPMIAFIVGLPLLPRDLLKPSIPSIKQISGILHYSKWMAAAMMLAALYEGLDVFLLRWLTNERQVGIYAGALTLAMIPDFLNGAVQTVIAPKIAPAHSAGEFPSLFKRYLRYALPLGAIALLGALILGGPIIRGLLSNRFADSVDAFKILVVATIFDVVITPLPAALVAFVAPRFVSIVNLVGLVIVAGGGLILIPRYGATGAAILILAARVTVGCVTVLFAGRITRGGGPLKFAV
jgi:O-antigen/teichoic acid export membrane protein